MTAYAKNYDHIKVTEKHCHYCGCELIDYLTPNREPYYEKSKWGYPLLKREYGIFTVDHKTPTSKGGTDDLTNLVACCALCNSLKKDTDYEVFKKSRK